MELSRHTIREKALQTLFSKAFNETISNEDAMEFALTYDKENDEVDSSNLRYLTTLVDGVLENEAKIDRLIERHLKNWTIQRLPRLDLTIMRIAVYEMMTDDDIPQAAAINEAIQLAKTFSDDKSRRFINAVLANIKDDLQEA